MSLETHINIIYTTKLNNHLGKAAILNFKMATSNAFLPVSRSIILTETWCWFFTHVVRVNEPNKNIGSFGSRSHLEFHNGRQLNVLV